MKIKDLHETAEGISKEYDGELTVLVQGCQPDEYYVCTDLIVAQYGKSKPMAIIMHHVPKELKKSNDNGN